MQRTNTQHGPDFERAARRLLEIYDSPQTPAELKAEIGTSVLELASDGQAAERAYITALPTFAAALSSQTEGEHERRHLARLLQIAGEPLPVETGQP